MTGAPKAGSVLDLATGVHITVPVVARIPTGAIRQKAQICVCGSQPYKLGATNNIYSPEIGRAHV